MRVADSAAVEYDEVHHSQNLKGPLGSGRLVMVGRLRERKKTDGERKKAAAKLWRRKKQDEKGINENRCWMFTQRVIMDQGNSVPPPPSGRTPRCGRRGCIGQANKETG